MYLNVPVAAPASSFSRLGRKKVVGWRCLRLIMVNSRYRELRCSRVRHAKSISPGTEYLQRALGSGCANPDVTARLGNDRVAQRRRSREQRHRVRRATAGSHRCLRSRARGNQYAKSNLLYLPAHGLQSLRFGLSASVYIYHLLAVRSPLLAAARIQPKSHWYCRARYFQRLPIATYLTLHNWTVLEEMLSG